MESARLSAFVAAASAAPAQAPDDDADVIARRKRKRRHPVRDAAASSFVDQRWLTKPAIRDVAGFSRLLQARAVPGQIFHAAALQDRYTSV
jgi:hypothetical protein